MASEDKTDRGEQAERSKKKFTTEERATYRTVLKRLAETKLNRDDTVGSLEAKGLLF